MKKTVVLLPSMGAGHLTPMLQLAKIFTGRGFAVAIVVIKAPSKSDDDSVASLSAANPAITFHTIPADVAVDRTLDMFRQMVETLRLATERHLAEYLRSVSAAAVVVDMFCLNGIDVAKELGIPAYLYYTSGACAVAAFGNLPYSDFATKGEVRIPGLPTLTADDFPGNQKIPEILKFRISMVEKFGDADGLLINTFESLEPNAVKALRDGVCMPGRPTPPVYCIGPLIAEQEVGKRHECLTWLDGQPERSVVFLCFGSMGSFSAPQIKEIAVGLEKSGQRFLWVIRGVLPDGADRMHFTPPLPELDTLLPEGFSERTKDVGMVVKSWAPQAAVLQHRAVGAFVTHCGWNSVLEAVIAGVPLICWPLYAEQGLNKVFIVEDMKLGVELGRYGEDIVPAERIEAKVRWMLKESDEAQEIRRRVSEVWERATEAVKDGGPSMSAFDQFIEDSGLGRECIRMLSGQ